MNNNERYPYAWGKGPRIYADKPGYATQRTSIIAGLSKQQLCAPLIFEGYCNRLVIECYFETVLLPHIGTGKTIVLDNASFHKGGSIKQIIEKFNTMRIRKC